jgi:hypothetical protein
MYSSCTGGVRWAGGQDRVSSIVVKLVEVRAASPGRRPDGPSLVDSPAEHPDAGDACDDRGIDGRHLPHQGLCQPSLAILPGQICLRQDTAFAVDC